MLLLNLLGRIVKILRSAATPSQIGLGFAVGLMGGLNPSWAFFLLAFLILAIFEINFSAGMFAVAVGKGFAYLLDQCFHDLGFYILTGIAPLKGLFITLYNTPFVQLTRFQNTVVMGSFGFSLLTFIPTWLFMCWFVIKYRRDWDAKIQQWKIVKIIGATKAFQFYLKVQKVGDKLW